MDLHLLGADGVFRAADAARHGLDSHALERLVRDGRCERVTRGGIASRRGGLVIHRPVRGLTAPGSSVTGPATEPPDAVPLGLAIAQAGLLAGPEAALVPADAALARGLVTREVLSAAVSALSGRRGIGPVRAALAQADGRHESPGESRTAYLLHALGLEFDPQVEVSAEGRRYRADFRIRGTRVLVEFDGQVKYADRAALFEEKRREDALRRAGWVVVRLVWSELARQPASRTALATGRYVRRGCDLRPVRHHPLAALHV